MKLLNNAIEAGGYLGGCFVGLYLAELVKLLDSSSGLNEPLDYLNFLNT
jgi:hypothetical protein